MARPPRIEFPGAWYHVMNRGAQKRTTFRSSADRLLFLDVLRDAVAEHAIEVHAYALMDNHYHLLIRTPRPNLSEAMRDLGGIYTQRFNSRHDVDGALFRGRFKAILVDADAYLLTVSRYIHRNPVEAGVVSTPARSRWTSYRSYLQIAPTPSWLSVGKTLNVIGSRHAYESFVEQATDPSGDDFYSKRRLDPILGTESFRRHVAELSVLRIPTPDEAIVGYVDRAVATAVAVEADRGQGHSQAVQRLVSATLAREFGARAETAALRYGYANAASVRSATNRFQQSLGSEQDIGSEKSAASLARIARRLIQAQISEPADGQAA